MKIQKREINPKVFLKVAGSFIGTERVQTIDARTLWKWLGVKSKFSDWIKSRIYDGQFVENKDFVSVSEKKVTDRINNLVTDAVEYHVTLDMAKHLAMLERNDKGRMAREYFIKCEKELFEVKDKISKSKHQISSLENEPLTLQGFSQLSLKDRKKQRSQIWEIWRKTNAVSKELNWRRIQVAKSVNLIINGMTTYRFRRLTGLSGLARDWMPLANQFCFYLAEHDLLDLLRARDWDVDFAYVERVYPELARIAKSRVELMYEVELDSSIEEEVNRVLDFVRQQVQSNVTPYLQTEAQVLNYQHDLTYELERLESLLVEPKKVKFWSPRPLRKSA